MSDFEHISKMIINKECDLKELDDALANTPLSEEQMMKLAIQAANVYELAEIERQYYESDEEMAKPAGYFEEFDPIYIENAKNHPLTHKLQLLLNHGLNPNTRLDDIDVNVMDCLCYVDLPFLAAYTMRLMLDHGADSNLKIDDYETIFLHMDSNVTTDLVYVPDDMVITFLQCWFVLIGYGGKLEGIEPFRLNPGHVYDELKEYEFFDHYVSYDPEKKKNVLHIVDIRTGEEIGVL